MKQSNLRVLKRALQTFSILGNAPVFAHCHMLQTMSNKVDFEGVYIEYYAHGDHVKFKYRFLDFSNLFPS